MEGLDLLGAEPEGGEKSTRPMIGMFLLGLATGAFVCYALLEARAAHRMLKAITPKPVRYIPGPARRQQLAREALAKARPAEFDDITQEDFLPWGSTLRAA